MMVAVAAIAVSALAALPYDSSQAAGIVVLLGFYFVLPMASLLVITRYVERVPRLIVAVAVPFWALWLAYVTVFLGPRAWVAGAISVAVVVATGIRLWRSSTSEGAAGGAAVGRSGSTGGG